MWSWERHSPSQCESAPADPCATEAVGGPREAPVGAGAPAEVKLMERKKTVSDMKLMIAENWLDLLCAKNTAIVELQNQEGSQNSLVLQKRC